ncbi:MAG: hypothetical protein A2081_05825 [Elusimicrobia bacterium GWC2_61_19]|nr:MAG: hypothetical protein A2081_05825 [Elusimicrobia bacterium GWC2_61_19]
MKKTVSAVLTVCLAFGAALSARYYLSGMNAAEVIRKLSGIRMALALYTLEHKTAPAAFEDLLREGKLEAAPAIKLRRHFRRAAVRNTATFEIKDSGAWAYVNSPKDPRFGLVYIDCAHMDEKGRYWSDF